MIVSMQSCILHFWCQVLSSHSQIPEQTAQSQVGSSTVRGAQNMCVNLCLIFTHRASIPPLRAVMNGAVSLGHISTADRATAGLLGQRGHGHCLAGTNSAQKTRVQSSMQTAVTNSHLRSARYHHQVSVLIVFVTDCMLTSTTADL